MAITFACPNGHKLKVADNLAGKKVACPRCKAPSEVPFSAPADQLDDPGLLGVSSLGSLPDLGTAAGNPLLDSEAPLDHSYVPRSVTGRNWHPVALGLKIHFSAAIAFAIGAALFWIALGIPLLPAIGELFPMFSTLALVGSIVCFACAAVLQVPGTLICLAAPDGQARVLLAASLATLLAMLPLGMRMRPTSTTTETVRVLLVVAAVSWLLWMLFLRRLAVVRGREEVAYDAVRLIGLGIVAVLAAAITLIVLSQIIVTVFAFVPQWTMRMGICAGLAIALYTVARLVEAYFGLEASWQALLYPTGLFFVLQYLEHVSSLQTLVARVGKRSPSNRE